MLYELKLHQGELDLGDDAVIVAHGEDDDPCPCGRQFGKHYLEVYLIEASAGYHIKGLIAPESFGLAKVPGEYDDDASNCTVVIGSTGKWIYEPNSWYGIEEDYYDDDTYIEGDYDYTYIEDDPIDFDDEP